MSNKSLKNKALLASGWVFSGHLSSQLIRLFGNLILTRLLVPEMFGVMAVVSVLLMGIGMFSDLGFFQNIVQSKRGEDTAYLNTAWTLQVIRGGVIGLVVLLLSFALYYVQHAGFLNVSSTYAEPQLPFVLALMSLSAFISGFNSVNLAILNRNLHLNKITLIELISQVAGLAVMILLAWQYKNIWSLVIGTIVSVSTKMILSHHPALGKSYHFGWDKDAFLELFHFGKWIFGASIFTFLMGQGDRLLLAGLIPAKELGVYTIAFFLAMAFKEVVRKVMSSVLYPALSEIVRTRPDELKRVYYHIRNRLDLVVMIVVGVLASSGHIAIDLLYDDRYQEAGWMLELLSLSSIFLGITMAGVCFMALGDSKSIMMLTAVSAIVLFISVPIAYNIFGLYGAVAAIALNSVVEIPLIFYKMHQYKLLSWKNELKMWPLFFLTYAVCRFSLDFLAK
jgi:O-antigen/teichoic acid export membrane protein